MIRISNGLQAAALLAVFALAGCANVGQLTCASGLAHARTVQLYFGRDVGGTTTVSEDDFSRFLDEEVSARFPAGFTVVDARGQWRGGDGKIVREPSKTVDIVLAGVRGEQGKLELIRQAYKTRFKQESVLIVERAACVGF